MLETDSLDMVRDRLRAAGMRVTKPREVIAEALLQADRPLSAENIREFSGLRATDLVTVYRTLDSFVSIGLVQRIVMEDGIQLFEVKQPGEHFHHVICRQCHRSERIEICLAASVERQARRHGFSRLGHHFEVFGLCPDCQERGEAT